MEDLSKRTYIIFGFILIIIISLFIFSITYSDSIIVKSVSDTEFGNILVGSSGMTLYIFTNDEPNISNCYNACADNWPPLNPNNKLLKSEGLEGDLGTTERSDGINQVTHKGMPLYYWTKDTKIGDTTGHGVNDLWFVAQP